MIFRRKILEWPACDVPIVVSKVGDDFGLLSSAVIAFVGLAHS
jgi:hypothetical protein